MFKNKFFRICLISLVFIISLFLFSKFKLNKENKININSKETIVKEEPKIVSCTRTTRLENEPQYDRALSLIQERVSKQYAGKDFDYFTSNLTNCIKIITKDKKEMDDAEGYFVFNSENIKDNYYPITVSSTYEYTDYITTALLLSHEITHVQQYIDLINSKKELSCIEKEVESFMSQFDFFMELNNEEFKSVDYRIKNDNNLHPQLQIIDAIWKSTKNEGSCISKFDSKDKDAIFKIKECQISNQRNFLRKMIQEDDYYKKQCDL